MSLRVRLVYKPAAPGERSDVPGWRLVGLLPEDRVPDPAERACGHVATEPLVLTLDRDEAQGYYLNLTSPEPSLFVLLRLPDVSAATASHASATPPEAVSVTASYMEGARWMDGGMVVVRTALPDALLGWIAEFAQHHFAVEGPKKRGRYRPSFLSREEFGREAARAMSETRGGRDH